MEKYLLGIRAWFNITETAQGENEIQICIGFSMEKYHQPLEIISITYTIPFTDQIAALDINIYDQLLLGKRWKTISK